MQLEELFDYKNQLMEDILTNESIVRLLGDDINPKNIESLAYSQVFPYHYVPETVQEAKTIICFDVDVQKALNKTYLLPTLYVWVFTHSSKMRLPQGGVRTDILCAEICKAINGSREYGLGELELYSVKRYAPMTDFQGKVMTFNALEFNRQYTAGKYIPENRKQLITK